MDSMNSLAGAGRERQDAAASNLTLACMKAATRWMGWKSIPNPIAGKKPSKVPYYTDGTARGQTDTDLDRSKLATYEEAKAVFGDNLAFALGPDGTGGFWQGVDFDNIEQNQLSDIANNAPGYGERSPSKKGDHRIGYGSDFPPLGSNGRGIEAYSHGRWFTVTEDMVRDAPLTNLAPWVEQVLAPLHQRQRPEGAQGAPNSGTVFVTPETVTHLRSALLSMRADDYDLWMRMGLALHELAEQGRGLWLEWSATSEKFNPQEAARKWDRDLASAHSIGYQSVFHEAQQRGWVNPASNAARFNFSAQPEFGQGKDRFPLLTDEDLGALPPQRWNVKGIIPESGTGSVFGPSGSNKTFVTLDLLASLSRGTRKWFGKRLRRVPCVYVPLEGHGGIPKRVEAWRKAETLRQMQWGDRHGKFWFRMPSPEETATNIRFVMDPINLRNDADRIRLVKTLKESGWAGGLLCIDTLAQLGVDLDENSAEGMGKMIAIVQDLQRRLGGVVLVIHHTGKDEGRGMRGWSGLRAALDFAIECVKVDGVSTLRLNKVKDGEEGTEFPFTMRLMHLGEDDDGDPITSLVVEHEHAVTVATESAPKGDAKRSADAQQDTDDEVFIHSWVKREVEGGNYPSQNSLSHQLAEMKNERAMTQKRVRGAIYRLRANSLLIQEKKSPSKNPWLRAVDAPLLAGAQE